MNEHSINVGVGLDARGLVAGAEQVKQAVGKMAGFIESGKEVTEDATFAFKSLQQAYNTSIRDAERLAAVKGTESTAFKDAAVKVAAYKDQLEFAHAEMAKAELILRGPGSAIEGTSKAYRGLSYSVAQVTREMPAFAHSAQVGFLALSNNIPILIDQMKRLKDANADLAATGQPVQSTFMALAKAVFSWQTALSVGVTLLTIYGAKLIEMSEGLFVNQKAIDDIQKSIDKMTISLANNAKALGVWIDYYGLTLSGKEKEQFEARQKKEQRFQEILKQSLAIQAEEARTGTKNLIARNMIYMALQESVAAYNKELQDIENKSKGKPGKIPIKEGGGESFYEVISKASQMGKMLDGYLQNASIPIENFVQRTDEQFNRVGVFIDELGVKMGGWANVLSTFAGDIFYALGSSLTGATDFMDDVKSIIGGIAGEIGNQLLAIGALLVGVPGLGGMAFGYLAAGAGLKVLSGILGGNAKGGRGTIATGGGGQAMYSGSFQPAWNPNSTYIKISGGVRGNNLVIAMDNQKRQNRRIR